MQIARFIHPRPILNLRATLSHVNPSLPTPQPFFQRRAGSLGASSRTRTQLCGSVVTRSGIRCNFSRVRCLVRASLRAKRSRSLAAYIAFPGIDWVCGEERKEGSVRASSRFSLFRLHFVSVRQRLRALISLPRASDYFRSFRIYTRKGEVDGCPLRLGPGGGFI